MRTKKSKIAFLGGCFDPPHLGHLLIAQDAYEMQNLERVYFVPTAQNPLKQPAPEASVRDRLAMLEKALGRDPRFGLLDLEIRNTGPSYTVETARQLRARFAGSELYWIIGADQLADLPRWRQVEELAQMLSFICVARPGFPMQEAPKIPDLRVSFIEGHLFHASSSEVRRRIKKQLPVDFFLPSDVYDHIKSKRLYQ